jgi:uncharacterized membrane protein YhaH (DUF805 family)
MRGEILVFDERDGAGQISGTDGNRYGFNRADFKQAMQIRAGLQVDFVVEANWAREIFVLPSTVPSVSSSRYTGAGAPPADKGMWDYFVGVLTTNFSNFNGRARRKEYWSYTLFATLIITGLFILMIFAGFRLRDYDPSRMNGIGWIALIILIIFGLWALIPSIALLIRRLHDIGASGWWVLLLYGGQLIPVVGLLASIAIIVIACIDSQRHPNMYGPPPKRV